MKSINLPLDKSSKKFVSLKLNFVSLDWFPKSE